MSTKKKATSAKKAAEQLQNPGTSVAVVASGALSLPSAFTPIKNLQMPSLVMKTPGEQRVLLFTSKLQVSTVKGKPGEARATVADVSDAVTGELFKFLVPSVVESSLVQNFGPPDSVLPSAQERKEKDGDKRRWDIYDMTEIVGKMFAIRNAGRREGKRHVDFEVVEVAPRAEE